MKRLILILACIAISSPALASLVLSPGLGYYSQKSEQSSPGAGESELTQFRMDLRLGYVLPMGLYVGGMYATTNLSDGTDSMGGNLMGPTIGYYSLTGFYTLLTYHILGETDAGANTKFTGAQGPQVDLGWVFPLTHYFAIGPQITWRSTEYEQLEAGGTSVSTDRKDTSIAPYLSLWFMF